MQAQGPVEEPLEIPVQSGPADARVSQSLAVTMRTPGADGELALGFLMGEAIVATWADVASVRAIGEPSLDKGLINIVEVALSEDRPLELTRLSRHTYTTSSCGVCGKATLEAVAPLIPESPAGRLAVSPDVVKTLHGAIAGQQIEFARTGGLHAAALFDEQGTIELPAGVEMVMPGDNVAMVVELITPVAMEQKLRFAIREGGRTVGAGVVSDIIE